MNYQQYLIFLSLSLFAPNALPSTYDGTYDYIANSHKASSKNKQLFSKGNFFSVSQKTVTIDFSEGRCDYAIKSLYDYTGGQELIDLASEYGGSEKLTYTLKQKLNFDVKKIEKEAFIDSPFPNTPLCKKGAHNFIFFTDNDVVYVDGDYVYKFSKPQISSKELEANKGNYIIAPLPIDNKFVDCFLRKNCDSRYSRYEGLPLALQDKENLGLPNFDAFTKLPSIGEIDVFLGFNYLEYEKETKNDIVADGGEFFTYLITIKSGKINYIRLGKHFLIDDGYKTIQSDRSGKMEKYSIKSNGVIIKVN